MTRLAQVCLLLALWPTTTMAQSVIVVDFGGNTYLAQIILPNGQQIISTNVQVIRFQPPQPTPSPVQWKVTGLHVLIVDDENLRGNLPQSQVNIFTSKPLKDWLTANAVAYRFSSNDSLKPGQPARELERPEFVAGWDLVSAAVDKGTLSLPAWIVSDGKKQVFGALPESVDAALSKLGEFK